MATDATKLLAVGANTALTSTDEKGRFVRTASQFRNWVEQGGSFPPEPGRYHLYISYACPWANRCLTTLYLKGLEDAVGVSVVHPTWQRTKPDDPNDLHTGWVFRSEGDPPVTNPVGKGSFSCQGCIPDPHNGAATVRDLYELAGGSASGKYSVPVLWDTKTKTIVNNESSEIMRMLSWAFNHVAKNPEVDLSPKALLPAIDEVNEWVYAKINNGVYRCGFAQSQAAYDEAVAELFDAMDRVESILQSQPFLVGDQLTEADIRLFQTLVRFDEVYVVYFKCNVRRIVDYPYMLDYCRRIYQMPGVARSVHMDHIKTHYFTSHPHLNAFAVIPAGPNFLKELEKAPVLKGP